MDLDTFATILEPTIFTPLIQKKKVIIMCCADIFYGSEMVGLKWEVNNMEWDFEMIGGNLVPLLPFFVLHISQVARFRGYGNGE